LICEPKQHQGNFSTDVEICFELEFVPTGPKHFWTLMPKSVSGNQQTQVGLLLGPNNPKQISSLIPKSVCGNFRQTQPNTDFDTAADIYVGLFSGPRYPAEILLISGPRCPEQFSTLLLKSVLGYVSVEAIQNIFPQ